MAVSSDTSIVRWRWPRLTRSDWLVGLLLALVMLMGAYFRYVGINWDGFTHFHPDERFLTGVVSGLGGGLNFTVNAESDGFKTVEEQQALCLGRYPNTNGLGGFFDAHCSPYNPHNTGNGLYVYGTLPLFIAKIASDTVVSVTGDDIWGGYGGAHLVWRAVSAFADLGTILVVFLIGRRLHGKWVGLLAALLYACAPLAIQKSHFATVNAMTSFFVTLALLFAIRVQDRGKLLDYALFGVLYAAAISSRINTLPLVGVVVLAAMVRTLPIFDSGLPWSERERLLSRNIFGLVVSGIAALVAFRFFSPYAFMGPGILGLKPNPRFFADIASARYQVSGQFEVPPNWQWVGRTGYLFPLWNITLWGIGMATGLSAIAGWGWSLYRLVRGKMGATRNLIPVAWLTAYFLFIGNLWVMSMRYYLPLYSSLALVAAWLVVEIVQRTNAPSVRLWRKAAARGLLVGVAGFSVLWGLMFTNIYRHEMSTVQASRWIWENVQGDFAIRIDGAPDTPLINIPIPNRGYGTLEKGMLIESQLSQLTNGQPYSFAFTAPADGVVSSVHAPHLGDPANDSEPETLLISITSAQNTSIQSTATLTANFTHDKSPFGDSYDIPLDTPLTVKKGESYLFNVTVTGSGPVTTSGSIMAWEGSWDETLPVKVCELPDGMTLADDPPPGLVSAADCIGQDVWGELLNGYMMEIVWEDVEDKREWLNEVLDNSEYIIIGTNRRYDSQSRIPERWPMTNRYYDALFSGELGFELAGLFQETFEFGPFRVSDQYLPTYSAPRWLNEFEAEEAFTVYDHPAVFIFRKTASYSAQKTHDILYNVPLKKADDIASLYNCPANPSGVYCDPEMVGVVPWLSLTADKAPTELQFTPDMQTTQYESGTWSSRYDRNSVINTQPLVTLLAWWLTIMVFGILAWPLLFVIFPGLADRGYGVAKLVGILLTAWLTWFVSSMRVSMWSQDGILVAMLLLAASSAYVGWRRRDYLVDYVRTHWRRLAWIEVIAFAAFVFFLVIRLTNPDLWHPAKGGEKPMNFAYFNAVLRSTVFPPIDPWFAKGYLNYYYFGYVIVGTPTLLLGVVPSIAYNLIIPTLFSLTGLAAFSVAFNIVSAWSERRQSSLDDYSPAHRVKVGNPWVAGIAALMLAVVLGNLDTIRVFGTGVAQLGGYSTPLGLEQYLTDQYIEKNGVPPNAEAQIDITRRAKANYLSDRLSYEFHNSASVISGLLKGTGELLRGKVLMIGSDRWYWGPSRVLAETPGVEGNAINEMPFFTFLYGDLHAHMIDMPVMLLVMVFLFNELLMAGKDNRPGWARVLALAMGALAVAVTRMTNSWDWITCLLLTVIGLTYIWWLVWRRLSRWSLASFAWRVGGFVIMNFVFMLPFLSWFATTSETLALWKGGKTPLWAYFDIHGMFLFLIFSLLIWDTARWFRSVRVGSLRGTWTWLVVGLSALGMILLGTLILTMRTYQAALIVVPAVIWIAALFFRKGQSRPMQYVLVLIGLGLCLTLGVEFVVLGADIGRQNTVFKFYIQAWLLFSVTGGVAFAWLIQSSERWSMRLRGGWFAVTSLLVVLAALYPVMATRGRAEDRMGPGTPLTLDGMEYMKYSKQGENGIWFDLIDDYNLIRWMQDNIQGSPVIIEAQSAHEYLWGSRVAIYTGLPSIVGWNFHQTQQRTFDPLPRLVRQRGSNVNAFYSVTDIDTTEAMISWYGIRYIVVAGLEKAYYPPEGLAKFDTMVDQGRLRIVYQGGEATLYEVIQNADDAVSAAQSAIFN